MSKIKTNPLIVVLLAVLAVLLVALGFAFGFAVTGGFVVAANYCLNVAFGVAMLNSRQLIAATGLVYLVWLFTKR